YHLPVSSTLATATPRADGNWSVGHRCAARQRPGGPTRGAVRGSPDLAGLAGLAAQRGCTYAARHAGDGSEAGVVQDSRPAVIIPSRTVQNDTATESSSVSCGTATSETTVSPSATIRSTSIDQPSGYSELRAT